MIPVSVKTGKVMRLDSRSPALVKRLSKMALRKETMSFATMNNKYVNRDFPLYSGKQ